MKNWMFAALLIAAPAFAQTLPTKEPAKKEAAKKDSAKPAAGGTIATVNGISVSRRFSGT